MNGKADLWMPLYIGDYLRDTRRLTTEQHGAYLLLIMEYWVAGPLPDDDAQLATICGLSLDAWSMHRAMLERFFCVSGGHWQHKRVDEERETALSNKASRSERARAAADARWHPPGNAPRTAPGNARRKPGACPSPSPDSEEGESPSSTRVDSMKIFGAWNRVAKATGLPEARQMTEKRRDGIRARVRELGEASVLEAISLIPERPFLLGGGRRGWKADLDWLIQPGSIPRILEGVRYINCDEADERASGWRP